MAFLHYEKFFTTPKDMNKEEDIAYDLVTFDQSDASCKSIS